MIAALILIPLAFFLFWKLYHVKKELIHSQEENQRLKKDAAIQNQKLASARKEDQLFWDQLNQIHLFAALSKEETKSASIKEKQTFIMETAENLLKRFPS